LLIVLVNKATKLFDYFLNFKKEYVAEIKLGVVTDTWDTDGKVLEKNKVENIDAKKIYRILGELIGKNMQIPPAYSAVKFKGRPSYSFARKGQSVELKPRIVNIYNLELISMDKDLLVLRVSCGSGTYIRSLVHGIGEKLGCGATMKGLRRTAAGDFNLDSSVSVENLIKEKIKKENDFLSAPYLISIERLLERNPNFYVKNKYKKYILNGHPIDGGMVKLSRMRDKKFFEEGNLIKIKDSSENLIAIHKNISNNIISDIKHGRMNLTKNVLILQ